MSQLTITSNTKSMRMNSYMQDHHTKLSDGFSEISELIDNLLIDIPHVDENISKLDHLVNIVQTTDYVFDHSYINSKILDLQKTVVNLGYDIYNIISNKQWSEQKHGEIGENSLFTAFLLGLQRLESSHAVVIIRTLDIPQLLETVTFDTMLNYYGMSRDMFLTLCSIGYYDHNRRCYYIDSKGDAEIMYDL